MICWAWMDSMVMRDIAVRVFHAEKGRPGWTFLEPTKLQQ